MTSPTPTGRSPAFEATLDGARRNEGWAFEALYQEWNRPMTGFVRARGVTDVDDVVSEIFLGAFTSIGGFRGSEADFRAWLFRIARNKVTDAHRRAGRRPVTIRLGPDGDLDRRVGGDVEVEAMDRLGHARLESLLGDLSDAQREVLLLRLVADLTIDQIATITGRRRGAVKQLQRRALRRLERQLSPDTGRSETGQPAPDLRSTRTPGGQTDDDGS